jgi:uncharacterized membrane protein
MRIAIKVFVGLLVAIHLGFFAIEAIFWEDCPPIRHNLGFNRDDKTEVAEVAKVAKNQGVSNAFLAAGLAWGLFKWNQVRPVGLHILILFLGFIAIAGIVGYLTINPPDPMAKAGFLVGQTGLASLTLICLVIYERHG